MCLKHEHIHYVERHCCAEIDRKVERATQREKERRGEFLTTEVDTHTIISIPIQKQASTWTTGQQISLSVDAHGSEETDSAKSS